MHSVFIQYIPSHTVFPLFGCPYKTSSFFKQELAGIKEVKDFIYTDQNLVK